MADSNNNMNQKEKMANVKKASMIFSFRRNHYDGNCVHGRARPNAYSAEPNKMN